MLSITDYFATLGGYARLVTASLIAAVLGASPVTAASSDPLDADFLAARAAFNRGDAASVDAFAPPFDGQLLEPYLAYWRLKLRLDAASREDVRAYLDRWPEGAMSDRLRVEWLKTLGVRRDWANFALDYPPPTGEDTELLCFAIQFRRQQRGDDVLAEARPLWFTGSATPRFV